jgi:Protein of unknown function (DUF2937)
MIKWLGGLFDRICAAAGALIFAQAPLFMVQYEQQLTGRAAELKLQVEGMRNAASFSGKSLEQFISKFLQNSDIDFTRQGELMQSTFHRWQSLTESLSTLQTSTVFERPFVFLTYLDTDIAKSTLEHFKFGLPFTLEGGVYAVVGILAGYVFFGSIRKVLQLLMSSMTFLLAGKGRA